MGVMTGGWQKAEWFAGTNDILSPMKVYVLNSPQCHVERANLFFCLCKDCGAEVNWRHWDASYSLYGACCINTFVAYPVRTDLEVYLVETQCLPEGGFDNVRRFPKKIAPSPPKNYG